MWDELCRIDDKIRFFFSWKFPEDHRVNPLKVDDLACDIRCSCHGYDLYLLSHRFFESLIVKASIFQMRDFYL